MKDETAIYLILKKIRERKEQLKEIKEQSINKIVKINIKNNLL